MKLVFEICEPQINTETERQTNNLYTPPGAKWQGNTASHTPTRHPSLQGLIQSWCLLSSRTGSNITTCSAHSSETFALTHSGIIVDSCHFKEEMLTICPVLMCYTTAWVSEWVSGWVLPSGRDVASIGSQAAASPARQNTVHDRCHAADRQTTNTHTHMYRHTYRHIVSKPLH